VHKSKAEIRGDLGFLVAPSTQVVAEYFETVAIQLGHPAFERNFPVRVRVEMAADEAHSDRLGGFGRRRQSGLTELSANRAEGQRPVQGLQFPVVAALIGEVERRATASITFVLRRPAS
jgi:hypothetical protein